MGRWENFELQEFFSLTFRFQEYFFRMQEHCFLGYLLYVYFFLSIFPCMNFFLYFARPSHNFPNGPSLSTEVARSGLLGSWGLFLESPDNFSGPESLVMSARFTLKIQILLVFKAKQ